MNALKYAIGFKICIFLRFIAAARSLVSFYAAVKYSRTLVLHFEKFAESTMSPVFFYCRRAKYVNVRYIYFYTIYCHRTYRVVRLFLL